MSEYYDCDCGRRVSCTEVKAEGLRCPACGKPLSLDDHETDVTTVDEEDTGEDIDEEEIVRIRRGDAPFRRFLLVVILLAIAVTALTVACTYHLVWVEGWVPLAIRKSEVTLAGTFYRLSDIKADLAAHPEAETTYPGGLLDVLREAGLLLDEEAPNGSRMQSGGAGEKAGDPIDSPEQ